MPPPRRDWPYPGALVALRTSDGNFAGRGTIIRRSRKLADRWLVHATLTWEQYIEGAEHWIDRVHIAPAPGSPEWNAEHGYPRHIADLGAIAKDIIFPDRAEQISAAITRDARSPMNQTIVPHGAIPDNARPTTPCDQWLTGPESAAAYGTSIDRKCGNTWGTPYPDEHSSPECTRCHHVCLHSGVDGAQNQPFRFLTGPEIAVRLYRVEAMNVLSASLACRREMTFTYGLSPTVLGWIDAVDRYLATSQPPSVVRTNLIRYNDDPYSRLEITLANDDVIALDITDPYNPTIIGRTAEPEIVAGIPHYFDASGASVDGNCRRCHQPPASPLHLIPPSERTT